MKSESGKKTSREQEPPNPQQDEKRFSYERKLSQKTREVEHFRMLYDKIHETERHLLNKCRELQALLDAQIQKSQTAVQRIEKQKAKILELENDLKKADNERQDLKNELFKLKEEAPSTVHSRVKTVGEHRHAIEELNRRLKKEMAENEKLRANKEETKKEGIDLREEIRNQKKGMDNLKREIEKQGEKMKEEEEALREELKKTDNEFRAKLRLEKKLKSAKEDLEKEYNKFSEKNKELNDTNEILKATNAELETEKLRVQFMAKRLEGLQKELSKLQDENKSRLATISKLQEDAALKTEYMKKKDEDTAYWKLEVDAKVRERGCLERKYQKLEEAKEMADNQIDNLKQKILNLEKDIDNNRKTISKLNKAIVDLTKEKSAVNEELRKVITAKEHEVSMVRTHKNKIESLRKLNREINEELSIMQKKLSKSQSEADLYCAEAKKLLKEFNSSINENHSLHFKLEESKRKLEDKDVEITKLKKACEHLTSLKSEHLRNFKVAQNMIEDFQMELKNFSSQADSLKKGVMARERELTEQRKIIERKEHEKVQLNAVITRHKKQRDDIIIENTTIMGYNDKLKSALKVKRKECTTLARLSEEYIKNVNKCKVKQSVLSRELDLWKEKCLLQSAVLERGRIEYVKRVQDINLLKRELVQTLRMKEVLGKQAARTTDMHLDLRAAYIKLVKQQANIAALESELATPTNIHRWRVLASTDPNTHQLIEVNQCLVNKLVTANAKISRRKIELKEKNRLIQEMQSFIARNNLTNVDVKLEQAQVSLRRKTEELKKVSAERDMYSTICENEREQRNSLDMELHKLNEEYAMMRRILARKSAAHSLYFGDDESSFHTPSEAVQQQK